MESSMVVQIEALVADWQGRLHQAWATTWTQEQTNVLWVWEKTLFRLLMELGHALVVLFVEAWHQRLCPDLPAGYRSKGWRPTPLSTLFGHRARIHTPYGVRDRRGRPGPRRGVGRRGPQGSGCFPVLETLGCRQGATPALLDEVGRQLSWGPSEAAALDRLHQRGIDVSASTMRRWSYALADEGRQRQQQALRQGQPAPGQQMDVRGQRVVVTLDGGRVRLRYAHPGRRRDSGYHGFEAPWQMPRLLVLYRIDEKGRALRQEKPLYDGVLTSATQLLERLFDHLQALQIHQARQVIFVADGAEEHWEHLPHLVEALGLQEEQVVEVLDWAHALAHLTTVADACTRWSERKRQHWLTRQRRRLARGQLQAVLDALVPLAQGRRARLVQREIAFFEKHAHPLCYHRFRLRGIPQGSGAVESAIRRVVNLRMKSAGTFWRPDNAPRMLFLRCQLVSGRWADWLHGLLFGTTETETSPEINSIPWAIAA